MWGIYCARHWIRNMDYTALVGLRTGPGRSQSLPHLTKDYWTNWTRNNTIWFKNALSIYYLTAKSNHCNTEKSFCLIALRNVGGNERTVNMPAHVYSILFVINHYTSGLCSAIINHVGTRTPISLLSNPCWMIIWVIFFNSTSVGCHKMNEYLLTTGLLRLVALKQCLCFGWTLTSDSLYWLFRNVFFNCNQCSSIYNVRTLT